MFNISYFHTWPRYSIRRFLYTCVHRYFRSVCSHDHTSPDTFHCSAFGQTHKFGPCISRLPLFWWYHTWPLKYILHCKVCTKCCIEPFHIYVSLIESSVSLVHILTDTSDAIENVEILFKNKPPSHMKVVFQYKYSLGFRRQLMSCTFALLTVFYHWQ